MCAWAEARDIPVGVLPYDPAVWKPSAGTGIVEYVGSPVATRCGVWTRINVLEKKVSD
jgi:hypothetical protein